MLCTWSWLGHASSTIMGIYQSDTDDLKAFMKRYSRSVSLLYCERQDGKKYLWRNPYNVSLSFKRSGWIALQ